MPPILGASCPRCKATLAHAPWVGVDFDGTLTAPCMVAMVQELLDHGIDVRVFTARCGTPDEKEVKTFCRARFGHELPITNQKDQFCYQLWDDRAVRVVYGSGQIDTSPQPWNPIPSPCLTP